MYEKYREYGRKKISALRVVVLGLVFLPLAIVGAMPKKRMTYRVIQYNDGKDPGCDIVVIMEKTTVAATGHRDLVSALRKGTELARLYRRQWHNERRISRYRYQRGRVQRYACIRECHWRRCMALCDDGRLCYLQSHGHDFQIIRTLVQQRRRT